MDFLRRKQNSMLTTLLFGFIILTFIFWGFFRSGRPSKDALTIVNGEEIPYREYQRILDRQMETYGKIFGKGKKLNKNLMSYIERRVVSELITRKVMAQEAKKFGIVIGKDDILAELKKIDAFQDPNLKRFSPRVYKLVLNANGMVPREFEKSLGEELAAKRLSSLIDNSLLTSVPEAKEREQIDQFKLNLHTTKFTNESLLKSGKIKISKAEIKKFYNKRKGEYLTPEKRVLEVARFDTQQYKNQLKISDDEVKQYYDSEVKNSKDKKWIEARAHALHILISEKSKKGLQEANRIKSDLLAERKKINDDQMENFFRQLAKSKSEDYASAFKGGDLGYFGEGDMVKPFSKAIFSHAKLRTILGPIATDFGYHLIYILDRTGKEKKLSNRSGEIRQILKEKKAKEYVESLKDDLSKKLANQTADDSAYLKAKGFSINTTDPVNRSAKEALVPFVVLQKAFIASKDQWQTPEEFEDHLFVYRTTKILPPQQMSLLEAKTRIKQDLLSDEAEKLVRNLHQEISSNKLKWASLKSYGASLETKEHIKVFSLDKVPGFSQSDNLLRAMQTLTPAQDLSEPILYQGEWIMMKADHFSNLADQISQKEVNSQKKEIETAKKEDVLDSFIGALVKSAEIPQDFREKYHI